MKHRDALDQLARETARARRALSLERALRAGFVLGVAIGIWALAALLGAHETLPLLLQSLSAAAALVVFAILAWRARRSWRAPTDAEARTRLARDSRLDAAAFDALQDQPSRFDLLSAGLWRREKERALARIEAARAGPLRPRLDDLDPFKIRYVLALALVAAAIFAGGSAPDRLARAFAPDPGPMLGDAPMQIEAWATPADYTRAAPLSLSDLEGERVVTPPAIDVTVRLTGPVGAPLLVFEGRESRRSARFVHSADGAWEAHMPVSSAGRLKIVRFHTRAHWRIAPTPDAAPSAAFTTPIAQLQDEVVSIGWRARDDFGVRRLALRVSPVTPPPGLLRADPVDTELEAPAGDPRETEASSEIDLAAHPYAGMEVEARIVAFDAIGQEGVSEPMRFTLPEKVFLQPLARAAIEIRRHLLAERRPYRRSAAERLRTLPAGDILFGDARIVLRDDDRRPPLQRAPEGVRRSARLIDALTMAPEDGYFRDLAVFLGFRLARSELAHARDIEEASIAADTLWWTALRAEYGGSADARRALEEAQRQLAQALTEGAPPERIRQLVDALRRAADAYMQALVQEALRNGDSANMEDTEDQTEISERDIEQMLQDVQRLSEQGRTAEAQALLNMLAGILSNLDVALSEQQTGEGGEDEQMQQSMDELAETMGEQRALRDETQQQQQEQQGQGGSGGDQHGGQGGDELAERQAQIRQGLAEAQRLGEESGAAESNDLNAAGEAMRRAEDALRRGDLEGAEAAQSAALNSLRQGADALAAEMRARGRDAREGGGEEGEESAGRDPLGRRAAGANRGEGEADISTQGDPVRAREVYDEIRRRAEDPNRPEAERQYLRRLLDRFGDS
jgi:hypothetical protein